VGGSRLAVVLCLFAEYLFLAVLHHNLFAYHVVGADPRGLRVNVNEHLVATIVVGDERQADEHDCCPGDLSGYLGKRPRVIVLVSLNYPLSACAVASEAVDAASEEALDVGSA